MAKEVVKPASGVEIKIPTVFSENIKAINSVASEFKNGLGTIAIDAMKASEKDNLLKVVSGIGVKAHEAFTTFKAIFDAANKPDETGRILVKENGERVHDLAFSPQRLQLLDNAQKKSSDFEAVITKAYDKTATLEDWTKLEEKTNDLIKFNDNNKNFISKKK